MSTSPPEPASGAGPAPPGGAPARMRRPWWIPPFLGRIPAGLDESRVRLLGFVALALLFENYDLSMLTAALKHIARDLGVAEGELGGYLGTIRLGAIGGFVLVALSDRIGRRRLFLATVIGSGLGTFLSAFAQTPLQFLVLQMVTRAFLVAGLAVAIVIVAEEFPAEHRGWGLGMLAALGASGVALGAIVFAAIDHLPGQWRSLYAVGAVPLVLVPLLRRRIEETVRYQRQRERDARDGNPHTGLAGLFRPMVELARRHPYRTAVVAFLGFVISLGRLPVFALTGYHLLEGRGWVPWEYSVLIVLGGALGIGGNIVAGHASDRFGRRATGVVLLLAAPGFAWLLYRTSGAGIWAGWIGFVFCGTGIMVILRALSAELFPTSHRGTAGGWVEVVDTLGAATGLALVGLASEAPGDLARAVSYVAFAMAVAAAGLFLLPETGQRELEVTSGEQPG